MLPLLADQADAAARELPPEVHDYYAGGSWDEVAVVEAEQAWRRTRLRPHVLRDVSTVDVALDLLGTRLSTPVLVAPTALHGLAHPDGERATAQGTADAGSLLVLSTRSSVPLEQVPAGPWWLQVYVMRDRGLTRALVQRAAGAGATALVLTGDTPHVALKKRTGAPPRGLEHLANLAQHLVSGKGADDVEQDPSAGLSVVRELADASGLPVLVKGVLRGDDARACLDAGAAGVVVSNHGGRQLDRAVPSAQALPEVADAVGDDGAVLVDGGLRSGLDVLTALALGARAVLVGRPVLWALAAGGPDGVRACLSSLTDDLARAMALAGATRLSDVTRDIIAPGR
ncbi:MAG TPA: alpha-hydroxy acid oxidase [Mycobacteriales bacterium]|nr:alpha-hydroxy acid oxidase [Mycobacteriales bacterium]